MGRSQSAVGDVTISDISAASAAAFHIHHVFSQSAFIVVVKRLSGLNHLLRFVV